MAYDPVAGDLYVADSSNKAVYSIATGSLARGTISLSNFPQIFTSSISYDPTGYIYVATQVNQVDIISDSSNTAVIPVSTPSSTITQTMAFDSLNGYTYVCDSLASGSSVTVLYGGAEVTSISPLSIGSGTCSAVGYSPQTKDVYVYRGGTSGTITVIDTSNNNAQSSITGAAGVSPDGFAYDSANGEMYAAEGTAGSLVYVISASNALSSVTVGSHPYALALDQAAGNDMVVTNPASGTVSFISGITNTVVRTVTVGTTPTIPLYDPVSGNLYVSDVGANNVLVVSPWGSYVVDSDAVGGASFAETFDSVDGIVDVASDGSTTVWVLPELRTLSVGSTPDGMAASSATDLLYVANSGAGTVSIIQADNSAVSSLTVGTTPDAVVYDSTTHDIAVANYASDTVSVISSSNIVSASISLGTGVTGPVAMAFDSNNGLIYVADNTSNDVSVLDLTTSTVSATISVGSAPTAIVYDPSNLDVYVANYGSGTVSVISGLTIAATVAVGTGPRSLAVSPDGHVAVANSGSNFISVISGTTAVSSTPAWTANPTTVGWGVGTGKFVVLFWAVGKFATVTVGASATGLSSALVSGSSEPSSLCSDPYSGVVYVTLWGANDVIVLSAATSPGAIGTYSVGTDPSGATYNLVNGESYVANSGSSSVADV